MSNDERFNTNVGGEPPTKDENKGKGYKDKINHIDRLLSDFEDMLEKSKEEAEKKAEKEAEKEKNDIEPTDMQQEQEEKSEEIISEEIDKAEELDKESPPKSKKGFFLIFLLLLIAGLGVYGYFKYYPLKMKAPPSRLKVEAVVVPKKETTQPSGKGPGAEKGKPQEGEDWSLYPVPIYFGANVDYKLASDGVETIGFTSKGSKEDIIEFYKKRMLLRGYVLKKEDLISPLNQVLMVYSKDGKDCSITLIEEKGELTVVISRIL